MEDERWAQISRIYNDAAALAPVDRAVFVRNACGDDAVLRAEIESLLLDDSRVKALLESKGSQKTLIGQRIGGYEIRSLLGVGGMGEVYRAHDPKLDRDVAIKVLPAGFASDGERLARLQREPRLLASLITRISRWTRQQHERSARRLTSCRHVVIMTTWLDVRLWAPAN